MDSWTYRSTETVNNLESQVNSLSFVNRYTPTSESTYNSITPKVGDEMYVASTITITGGSDITTGYYKRNISNTTWVDIGSTLGLT